MRTRMLCADCGAEMEVGETFYEWTPTGEVLCENCLEERIQSMSVRQYLRISGAEEYEREGEFY